MIEAVYIPDPVITVTGIDEQNKPLILEYDKKTGELLKYSQKKEDGEKKKDFDLFLKLFFNSYEHTVPETMTKTAKSLSEKLKSNGISLESTIVSVDERTGAPVISIGKEKRFSSNNELAVYKDSFLPSHLATGDDTIVFSHYHKSVLPASFPGKIDFYKNGILIKTWLFYRPEFRQ
jgi:hypothetical protein